MCELQASKLVKSVGVRSSGEYLRFLMIFKKSVIIFILTEKALLEIARHKNLSSRILVQIKGNTNIFQKVLG